MPTHSPEVLPVAELNQMMDLPSNAQLGTEEQIATEQAMTQAGTGGGFFVPDPEGSARGRWYTADGKQVPTRASTTTGLASATTENPLEEPILEGPPVPGATGSLDPADMHTDGNIQWGTVAWGVVGALAAVPILGGLLWDPGDKETGREGGIRWGRLALGAAALTAAFVAVPALLGKDNALTSLVDQVDILKNTVGSEGLGAIGINTAGAIVDAKEAIAEAADRPLETLVNGAVAAAGAPAAGVSLLAAGAKGFVGNSYGLEGIGQELADAARGMTISHVGDAATAVAPTATATGTSGPKIAGVGGR